MRNAGKRVVQVATIMSFIFAASPGMAQQTTPGEAAVADLLAVSGARQQYDQMRAIMSAGMKRGFARGFVRAMQGKSLTPEQKTKARAIAKKHFEAFLSDFDKFVTATMPWETLVKEVYTPVYLRHFSVEEIRQLSVFFRSSIGKKFVENAPQLIQESASITNERYGDTINRYAAEQMQRRLKQMESELKKL